jgi:5'(3')-deoxyribonucleotidase
MRRIAVDIDSILADTLEAWLTTISGQFSVHAAVEDITQWEMHKCPALASLTKEQVLSVLDMQYFYAYIPPMPGAADALKTLMGDGHEVYLVTARWGKYAAEETSVWLKNQFPFLKWGQYVNLADKHCFKADVLIEDRGETLEKYSETWPEAKLVTIDYPYNRNVAVDFRAPRGSLAWGMIVQYIRSLGGSK